MKLSPAAIAGQVVLYGAFAAFIGFFATEPRYKPIPPDTSLIKLSINHLGERDCRKRTAEELEKLPRNMRNPLDCPRERSPLKIQFDLDGKTVYDGVAQPSGIAKDGIATMYQRFQVASGEHTLAVRMNDNAKKEGFTHVKEATVTLKPYQVLVIDFNPDRGGLFFQ